MRQSIAFALENCCLMCILHTLLYMLIMAATPGSYRCMACGLVFDTEDEAKRHEEQHPGMVRKATDETAPP